MAEVAARSRKAALANPNAQLKGDDAVSDLLGAPYIVTPLRKHDCPPITDGAAAVVLAAGDLARQACERPAWIRGIDHRIEPHGLGVRDLTASASTRSAAEKAGVNGRPVDVAELHAPFSHQELILRDALGLGDGVDVNPSGGALAANVMMAAGLTRIGEAAQRIIAGDGRPGGRARDIGALPPAEPGVRARRGDRTERRAVRGRRRRADEVPVDARRRVDRRSVSRGRAPCPRGRADDVA